MKFGMFIIGDNLPEAKKQLGGYYDEMFEQVKWAE